MKNNNKTAILTIQRVKNYGASLQVFALQTTLIKMGISNEIIDFIRNDVKEKTFKSKFSVLTYKFISILKQFRRYLLNVLVFKDLKLRKLNSKNILFENFENNYLNFSKIYLENDLKKLNKNYQNFVCGSDQVWNHTFNFSINAYFLDFVENTKNRIAFAPSFGVKEVPKILYEKYNLSFQKFNHLSIREVEGAKIIKDISGKEIEVLLDPVFLLTKEDWIKKLDIKQKVKKPYILCYTLGEEDMLALNICRKIKEKTGYEIVRIGRSKKDMSIIDMAIRWDVGPVEFLDLILNAKLVITNSFHGTAFSLNFGVPFFCVLSKENKRNSRILNVLRLVGLDNRIVYEYTETILEDLQFGNKVETLNIIQIEREKSKEFLQKVFI